MIHDVKRKEIKEDTQLDNTQWYKEACSKLIRLAAEASESLEAHTLMDSMISEFSMELSELCLS